jgi:hypothetical protein
MFYRIFKTLCTPLASAWDLLHAPAPVRPIAIIESDDWGRSGLPSLASLEQLKAAGVPIGVSPWDFYGIESEEDVIELGNTLLKHRDCDGRPACITANFIVANADIERMRRENFETFYAIPISSGGPQGNATLLPAYQRNVKAGVFYPGLHGFTHFNAIALMNLLKEPSIRGNWMRQLAEHGVPYLASLTPECNFALVERRDGREFFLSRRDQARWVEAGIRTFEEVFEQRPTTTCAPGYRADAATFQVWRRNGIESAQFNGGQGITSSKGIICLERNVSLEPALDNSQDVGTALEAARDAVQRGLPIILCSHSINYISRYLQYATKGRRQLSEILYALLETFPNLRFASDGDLVVAWRAKDPSWFRAPTSQEIAARSYSLPGRNPGRGKPHDANVFHPESWQS